MNKPLSILSTANKYFGFFPLKFVIVSSVSMNILVHGFSHIYEEKFQRRDPDV